jgi:hypothetical protein
MDGVPHHGSDNPNAKQSHRRALGQSCRGPITQGHSNHDEADRIVCRITKEVESIGL